MTPSDHLRAAARCWERAGFFPEAAERFTTAEAWRDAGRCFSQAECHSDAAFAFSRGGEPLLEAREHLMADRPERARSLYERFRSELWLPPSTEVEVALGLSEVEEAIRVTSSSGDREAAAGLARLASARGRADLATSWLLQLGFAPWNRSLRWLYPLPVAEVPKIWPSVAFSEVTLAQIWAVETGNSTWGDRALDWSGDGTIFAAALDASLVRGHMGPDGVHLKNWRVRALCCRFLPESHAVLAGLESGEVSLFGKDGWIQQVEGVRMPGRVLNIEFAPEGDRVAVAAQTIPGSLLKISTWREDLVEAQLDEHMEFEELCYPATAWSPNGRQLCWSPGPEEEPNRLFLSGQPPVEAHREAIGCLEFTADGRFLISGSCDRTVVIRDGVTGQALAPPEQFDNHVHGATVHSQAALLAVGDGNRLHLLRVHPGEAPRLSRLSELPVDGSAVTSLAFSPDGRHLLVMTEEQLHLFRVDLKP